MAAIKTVSSSAEFDALVNPTESSGTATSVNGYPDITSNIDVKNVSPNKTWLIKGGMFESARLTLYTRCYFPWIIVLGIRRRRTTLHFSNCKLCPEIFSVDDSSFNRARYTRCHWVVHPEHTGQRRSVYSSIVPTQLVSMRLRAMNQPRNLIWLKQVTTQKEERLSTSASSNSNMSTHYLCFHTLRV